MFQGVHSTVIGDSHIRKGIVCQDSSGTVVTDQFAIAVVADGHGSAKHFRGFEDCCKDYDKVIKKLYEPF